MAVTARFLADFSNFFAAVQKADIELRTFESGSGRVTAALTRMANSFSGQKIIQQATLMTEAVSRVGGASTLTAREQARVNVTVTEAIAKYQALGQTAPPAIQALADQTRKAGDAAFNWRNILASVGGVLGASFSVAGLVSFTRELLRTGDELVKISAQTDLTIDEVQRLQYAADQTGVSFGSMVSAVQDLQAKLGSGDAGVTGAIRALNVDLASLKALAPYQQFVLLADAVGQIDDPTKRAAIAVALFGKNWKELLPVIRADIAALSAEAPVMSDRAARSLDQVSDKLSRLWGLVKAAAGNLAAFSEYVNVGDRALRGVSSSLDALNGVVPKVQGRVKSIGEQFNVTAGAARALTIGENELKRITEQLTEPVQKNIAVFQKLREQIVGPNLQTDVDMLTRVLADLRAEGSLTPTVFANIVAEAVKLRAAGATLSGTLSSLVKEFALLRGVTSGLGAEFSNIGQQVGLNLEPLKQITDEAKFFADQAAFAEEQAKGMARATEEVGQAAQDSQEPIRGIGVVATIAYGDVISGAQAAARAVRLSEAEFTAAARAIRDAYFAAGFIQHITGPSATFSTPPFSPPAFASGVTNFRGGQAIVGERGPELVTLPRGASVTPNSALGGTTINVYVDGSGSLYDTPAGMSRLGRVVADAVDRTARGRAISVGRA